jgi:hypothetical protein
MITSTLDSDRSPDSLKAAADSTANDQEDSDNNRRYMDAINSAGRTLNLDRRGMHCERRIDLAVQYNGPARRKIIDRRENPGNRRG